MRTTLEVAMMLVVTGVTNLCMLPAIVFLCRKHFIFEAFIGTFTMITSFMYHVCDSIDGPLWLTEGQWHRLDNIGSIMSFVMWNIHLMDLRQSVLERYMQYFFLAMVLVLQEKNPWDEWNAAIPIASSLVLLLVTFAMRRRVPTYDYQQLRRGLLLLACGILCFVRGLDDDNDPLRFYHGCWHGFVGAAGYYNFKVLLDRNDRSKHTSERINDHIHCTFSWIIANHVSVVLPIVSMVCYGSIYQVDGDVTNLEQQEQNAMSLADRLYAYDLAWSTKLYQRFGRDPRSRLWWEVFSHSGDGFFWILTIPPLMGLFWMAGFIGPFAPVTKMFLSSLFTVMIVDIIAIMLLKLVFHRHRPPFHEADRRFVGPDQHSFPSGHSTRVWTMVAMLMYLAETHSWVLRQFFFGLSPAVLVAISIIWAIIINFSRVALGRHYPSDVLAGSLIGFFVFWPISLFFIKHYKMLSFGY